MTKISNQYSLTNVLFADAVNGRVGIGTTSPTVPLDVVGAGKFSGVVTANIGSYAASFVAIGSSAGNGQIQLSSSSNYSIGAGTDFGGMGLYVGGAYRMYILNNGNVGIGTTSPSNPIHISSASNTTVGLFEYTGGANAYIGIKSTSGTNYIGNVGYATVFETGGAERMRITSAGNVGINTTYAPGPNGLGIAIYKNDYPRITFRNSTTGDQASGGFQFYLNGNDFYQESPGNTIFANGGTERMRINAAGFLKASNDGTYGSSAGTFHEIRSNVSGYTALNIVNSSTNPYAVNINFPQTTPNNTSNYFFVGSDLSAIRFYIYSNGNIVNTNGSYGTLSDITLKENVVDATPKLEDILQLKVRNFNFIGDETKQIGFIAQEFEEIFPSMIDVDGKSNKKSIKTSVLVPMLVKAIQELSAQASEQQLQINELKALLNAH